MRRSFKRGKGKQKRHDLRLVGLALVVTSDVAVPVVPHPYPGNRHDSSQFTGLLDLIHHARRVKRWQHGEMVLRYTAAGMLATEAQFRRSRATGSCPSSWSPSKKRAPTDPAPSASTTVSQADPRMRQHP